MIETGACEGDMTQIKVEAVVGFGELLRAMLQESSKAKGTNTIEPVLTKSIIGDVSTRISAIRGLGSSDFAASASQNAVIDAAVRDVFNALLVSEHQTQPKRTNTT